MSHYWLRRLFGSARPEVGSHCTHPFLFLAHRLEAIWRDRERREAKAKRAIDESTVREESVNTSSISVESCATTTSSSIVLNTIKSFVSFQFFVCLHSHTLQCAIASKQSPQRNCGTVAFQCNIKATPCVSPTPQPPPHLLLIGYICHTSDMCGYFLLPASYGF